jgi:hypothetical protein
VTGYRGLNPGASAVSADLIFGGGPLPPPGRLPAAWLPYCPVGKVGHHQVGAGQAEELGDPGRVRLDVVQALDVVGLVLALGRGELGGQPAGDDLAVRRTGTKSAWCLNRLSRVISSVAVCGPTVREPDRGRVRRGRRVQQEVGRLDRGVGVGVGDRMAKADLMLDVHG